MREIRYPPHPFAGETREQWERRALRPWRNGIKIALLQERGWRCERCGKPSTVLHLDEAVIPRCDMKGFSLEQRRLAFGEPCLSLSCPDCNVNQAHDRDGAWERNCERYGERRMREWYRSLGLKAPAHPGWL